MSTNHAISALISSINNAGAVKKSAIKLPFNNVVGGVLRILLDEGFIASYEVYDERPNVKFVTISLKYVKGKHSIQEFKVVSTPGKRIYSSPKSLLPYYDSLGFYIFSTSKGIITDNIARQLNVGGEILCKVF
jgi:small subunit ribosomal protein S8